MRLNSLLFLTVHGLSSFEYSIGFVVTSQVGLSNHGTPTSDSGQDERITWLNAKISRGATGDKMDLQNDLNGCHIEDETRRNVLGFLPVAFSVGGLVQPASARLVQFPCEEGDLMNTYHLMRAGESLLEQDDILGTNPPFITNREAALSDVGIQQVQQACRDMIKRDVNPSSVRFSLAAKCIDTADMIATEMKVGRNRILPEYTYMDPRGIGKWDMLSLSSTEPAIWALDALEGGKEGKGGRPPPNDDGTPNETLSNQVTRLQQLMSLLEGNSGETFLLIFPDGTGPALLSALIGGIPLNRVHELNFEPGEVRYNVNKENVLKTIPEKPTQSFAEIVNKGSLQLQYLREHPDEIMTVKEQQYRAEMTTAAQQKAALQKARSSSEQASKEALLVEQKRERIAKREEMMKLEAERAERREAAAKRRSGFLQQQKDDDSGNSGHLPDFVSLASLGLAGYMVSWRYDRGADVEADTVKDKLPCHEEIQTEARQEVVTDAIEMEMDDQTPLTADNKTSLVGHSPELEAMEELIEKAPIDIPEIPSAVSRPRQQSSKALSNPISNEAWEPKQKTLSVVDRVSLAESAMEEYLERDDGGDAWLGHLSTLMDEEI